MKFYFQRKTLIGFALAITIITWLGVASYFNNHRYKVNNQWVVHTNDVLFHAERVLSLISDIESGQRGFVITGDTTFLEPYHSGNAVIRKDIDALRGLVRDNQEQLERVAALSMLIEEKLTFSEGLIVKREQSADMAARAVATQGGKILMDRIRDLLTEFKNDEKQLLVSRTARQEADLVSFSNTFTGLLVSTGMILVLVFVAINRNLKARNELETSLRQALERAQDMYDNAPCGYHSLDAKGYFLEINKTELDWIGYTHDEVVGKMRFPDILTKDYAIQFEEAFVATKKVGSIRDVECEVKRKDGTSFPVILNATLLYDKEGNVIKSRSTVFDYTEKKHASDKIMALNQELEAFTYSVSHDLRAPLRSIDGYSRILADDYLTQLNDEGQRVLNVIVKNANKMGKLIDDLLDFSRFGRKEMTKARYSMESLIQSAFDEQIENNKGRVVEYKIHAVANALSDPHLMKQVWINLISNAMKYTGRKEKSIVEITSQTTDKEVVYSIRDNGTGFDMNYVHKLFNVFQRLHKPQDFEGTGVGLAIVHRIISRHGGRVWAESKLNEGAAFYITLPVDQKTLETF